MTDKLEVTMPEPELRRLLEERDALRAQLAHVQQRSTDQLAQIRQLEYDAKRRDEYIAKLLSGAR